MTNHKWDLKSNYMLAFTVCKHPSNPNQWISIAADLKDIVNTTPQVSIINILSLRVKGQQQLVSMLFVALSGTI
jgi:hypothetical protein